MRGRSFKSSGGDSYDRFIGRYSKPLAAARADAAGIEPGMRALDIACGAGALTAGRPPLSEAALSGSVGVRDSRPCEDGEEVADVLVAGKWVGQRKVGVDRVLVASAVAGSRDIAGPEQLGDDAVRSALGDPHAFADLA